MRPTTSKSKDVTSNLRDNVLDLSNNVSKRPERRVPTMKWHDDAGDKVEEENGDGDLELKGQEDYRMVIDVSDDPSNSKTVDMNSNTNGKVLMGSNGPLENTNDNRQHLPDGPAVLKKVKQISMEQQVPLNLTGLGLSGSGLQLFVKMDKSLEQRFGQAEPELLEMTLPKPRNMRRRRSLMTKRIRDDFGGAPTANTKGPDGHQAASMMGAKSPVEQPGIQIKRSVLRHEPKRKDGQTERPVKDLEFVETQFPPGKSTAVPQDDPATQKQQLRSYKYPFPHAHISSQPRSKNVISGPVWNIQNGEIDVFGSLDRMQSSQNAHVPSTSYDTAVNYNENPFRRGFESGDLPLKRRNRSAHQERHASTSPIEPRRREKCRRRSYYNTPSEFDGDDEDDDDYDDEDDFFRDNPHNDEVARRDRRVDNKVGRKSKNQSQVKSSANRQARPSMSDEDVRAGFSRTKPKLKPSNTSDDGTSSIGPQFETTLLQPQGMDTDTLIKFTQFTQDLRKDLKQKYKDLNKLLKNFEETVQERNNNQTAEKPNADARCIVM